jgi:hypothetical protein
MYSTNNYNKKFNIGDLFLYDEGSSTQDLGYISNIVSQNKEPIKIYIYWFNQRKSDLWKQEDPHSQETIDSINKWNKSYIFPVVK